MRYVGKAKEFLTAESTEDREWLSWDLFLCGLCVLCGEVLLPVEVAYFLPKANY